MKRSGSSTFGYFVVVALMILVEEGATAATVYTVGDSLGWALPNSTDYYNEVWAKNKTFLIGDTLEFKVNDSLAYVSKEQYENCTQTIHAAVFKGPNLTVTRTLVQNGTLYFTSMEDDHCIRGQKLKITVGNGIEPPSSAAPPSLPTAPLPLFILSIIVISLLNSHASLPNHIHV